VLVVLCWWWCCVCWWSVVLVVLMKVKGLAWVHFRRRRFTSVFQWYCLFLLWLTNITMTYFFSMTYMTCISQ
jgi:hypothetical protein